MDYESDNISGNTPIGILDIAKEVPLHFLPIRSKVKYEEQLQLFKSY